MNLSKPHKNMRLKNDSGFTLIEVLIAVGIFAIGLLAVGLMQTYALRTTNFARQTTEAMTLAEDRAEWLRALPFYDSAADLDGVGGVEPYDIHPDLSPAGNPHVDDVAGPFTVRWTVTDDVPLPAFETDVLNNPAGGDVKRSKTIRVWVTPDNNAGDTQAELEFAKFCGQI